MKGKKRIEGAEMLPFAPHTQIGVKPTSVCNANLTHTLFLPVPFTTSQHCRCSRYSSRLITLICASIFFSGSFLIALATVDTVTGILVLMRSCEFFAAGWAVVIGLYATIHYQRIQTPSQRSVRMNSGWTDVRYPTPPPPLLATHPFLATGVVWEQ
jgi:hypothetical protein